MAKFFETFSKGNFLCRRDALLPWPTELLFARPKSGVGPELKKIIPRLDLCHFEALLGGAWPEAA